MMPQVRAAVLTFRTATVNALVSNCDTVMFLSNVDRLNMLSVSVGAVVSGGLVVVGVAATVGAAVLIKAFASDSGVLQSSQVKVTGFVIWLKILPGRHLHVAVGGIHQLDARNATGH
jgi:hypothetical protein